MKSLLIGLTLLLLISACVSAALFLPNSDSHNKELMESLDNIQKQAPIIIILR